MAFTVIGVVPSVAIPVGAFGPFVVQNISPTISVFKVQIDFSAWPVGGGDVISVLVEESGDGGLTWKDNLSFSIGGGPVPVRPPPNDRILCPLDFPGIPAAQHQLRIGGNCLRAVTTGFTLSAQ